MIRPYSNPEFWPGDGRGAQGRGNNATASLGVQTLISPTLINEFRGGWLYTSHWFGLDGPTDYRTIPRINYNYGDYADTYVCWELPLSAPVQRSTTPRPGRRAPTR